MEVHFDRFAQRNLLVVRIDDVVERCNDNRGLFARYDGLVRAEIDDLRRFVHNARITGEIVLRAGFAVAVLGQYVGVIAGVDRERGSGERVVRTVDVFVVVVTLDVADEDRLTFVQLVRLGRIRPVGEGGEGVLGGKFAVRNHLVRLESDDRIV